MAIQKTETKLANLKINRLTKKMYDDALIAGTLNPNELYLTDEDIIPSGQEMDKNIYDPNNIQKNIFASIPGYSILDNGYFILPVNQRGLTMYTSSGGTSIMSIDRWGVLNGRVTIIKNGGLQLTTNTTLFQNIPTEYIKPSDIYTATLKLPDGTKYSVTGTFKSSAPYDEIITPKGTLGLYMSTYPQVAFKASTDVIVESIKVEVGNMSTEFIQKGYGAELNECRRYYQRVFFAMRLTNNGVGITFNPPMRIAPTLSFTAYGGDTTPTAISVGIYGGWLSIPDATYYTGHVIASADL